MPRVPPVSGLVILLSQIGRPFGFDHGPFRADELHRSLRRGDACVAPTDPGRTARAGATYSRAEMNRGILVGPPASPADRFQRITLAIGLSLLGEAMRPRRPDTGGRRTARRRGCRSAVLPRLIGFSPAWSCERVVVSRWSLSTTRFPPERWTIRPSRFTNGQKNIRKQRLHVVPRALVDHLVVREGRREGLTVCTVYRDRSCSATATLCRQSGWGIVRCSQSPGKHDRPIPAPCSSSSCGAGRSGAPHANRMEVPEWTDLEKYLDFGRRPVVVVEPCRHFGDVTADIAAFGSALATTRAPRSFWHHGKNRRGVQNDLLQRLLLCCCGTTRSDELVHRADRFPRAIARRRLTAALMDFFRTDSSPGIDLPLLTSTISGFSDLAVTAPVERTLRGGAFQVVGRARLTNGSGEFVWSSLYISLYPIACGGPFQMIRRFQYHDVDSVFHLVHG